MQLHAQLMLTPSQGQLAVLLDQHGSAQSAMRRRPHLEHPRAVSGYKDSIMRLTSISFCIPALFWNVASMVQWWVG